ncbi:MAG: CPBP family intramembrane glutamic endopeptidase [Syntrophomonadaceae bacterium]|nr:CPBP family intramembrane glutamic endopeptidase [Syntrophomonadaceae bacterium]
MEQEKTAVKKRLAWFVALTFIITWLVFMLIPLLGLPYGQGVSIFIVMAGMFVPALCNLLTRLITREGLGNMYLRPNFKGHRKQYLLVFFGPTALLFLSAALYFLIFPGTFDPELAFLQETAAKTAGMTAYHLLLISILEIIIIGPVINIIPTLGEELGWRGYLLPKLRRLLSDRAALVVTGILWGLWHTPVIVMGHNYGTGYLGYPWLGILAMIVFCVGLGVIEGYASIKLESVIPAAMIHSAVNAGAGLPILMAKDGYNAILGPAITGFIGGLPFIVLAVVLLMKTGSNEPA